MAVLSSITRPTCPPRCTTKSPLEPCHLRVKLTALCHYAIVEDGGITVIEIWDSIDQHDAWFNEVVKPHLPPDTPEPKFAELHNSNAK